jgi:hypothetical protein
MSHERVWKGVRGQTDFRMGKEFSKEINGDFG